jgi:hypothetical protein
LPLWTAALIHNQQQRDSSNIARIAAEAVKGQSSRGAKDCCGLTHFWPSSSRTVTEYSQFELQQPPKVQNAVDTCFRHTQQPYPYSLPPLKASCMYRRAVSSTRPVLSTGSHAKLALYCLPLAHRPPVPPTHTNPSLPPLPSLPASVLHPASTGCLRDSHQDRHGDGLW